MKILVTGGAGFIGSHTVDLFVAKGYDVRILDNLQPRVHPRGKPTYLNPRAEFIQGDVADRTTMERALQDVEGVVHLAAYQDYLPDFSTFIHTNAESTALIFEIIVANKLRVRKMVFASSQSVAGEGKYECEEHGIVIPEPRPLEQLSRGEWEIVCPSCGRRMQSRLIDEATVSPHTSYAISKYTIELLANRLGHRYEIPTACMRYTYVQGSRNSFHNAYSGIARRFALTLMAGGLPTCYEDGQQLRDYINVADVARANVLVFESPAADFGVFNAGGGRAVTVVEFARMMLREFGVHEEPLIPGEFRLGDTRHTVSNIAPLQALGWKPTIAVEQNVREYVAWLREQPEVNVAIAEADEVMRKMGVVRRVVAH